jgi:hypothetical protein
VPFVVPAAAGQPATRKISIAAGAGGVSVVSLDLSGGLSAGLPGDFSGGQLAAGGAATTWPIQQGDYLVIHGTICKIPPITSPNPFAATLPAPLNTLCNQITLATPLTGNLANIPATTDYYFVRAPRPLTGESTLKLPQDVVIDTTLSVMGTTNNQLDILFSPSGELLAPTGSNKVILWVRDRTKPLPPGNIDQDSLIAVDIRTGMIAAQPVNQDPNDYYAFTRDGRPSGL